jgi:hypothetical protein
MHQTNTREQTSAWMFTYGIFCPPDLFTRLACYPPWRFPIDSFHSFLSLLNWSYYYTMLKIKT